MEYESYIHVLASTTTFDENKVSAEMAGHFTDWMLDTPNLAYQYAN